jgi:hypothetical protein
MRQLPGSELPFKKIAYLMRIKLTDDQARVHKPAFHQISTINSQEEEGSSGAWELS